MKNNIDDFYLISGDKAKCFGCNACVSVCLVNCLTPTADELGLIYPVKNESMCINCGKCERVCPAVKELDFHVIRESFCSCGKKAGVSTSGGIFYELAAQIISQNGCVFGCEMTADFKARHIMIESEAELARIMGSKYLQSDISDCYSLVKTQLECGRLVLFSGTPCQIAALYGFLGRNYDQLYTVDIFCHGVPSTAVFDRWITETEKKYAGRLIDIRFRHKERFGWQHSIAYTIVRSNGSRLERCELPGENPFYYLYLYGYIMRESCKDCKFSRGERIGDISLGDCWSAGEKYGVPAERLRDGLTFVSCNTEKGSSLFDGIDKVYSREYDLEIEKQKNSALSRKKSIRELDISNTVLSEGIYAYHRKNMSLKIRLKETLKRILPKRLYILLSRG